MRDPRAERLAELIVGYSLELAVGDVVRIDGGEPSTALALEALNCTGT